MLFRNFSRKRIDFSVINKNHISNGIFFQLTLRQNIESLKIWNEIWISKKFTRPSRTKKSMEYRICVWWCDTMLQAIIVYMPGAHNIRNMQSQRRQKTASASALILNSLITSFTWANSISIENNHNLNVN